MAISTSDFLVGDGASSVIRRRAGLKFEPKDFALRAGLACQNRSKRDQVEVKYLDEFSGYLCYSRARSHLLRRRHGFSGNDAGPIESQADRLHRDAGPRLAREPKRRRAIRLRARALRRDDPFA